MYSRLKHPLRGIIPLLSVFFVFYSCIDDGYNLNDLDTDSLYVGGNWTLPLGEAVIAAAEILDLESNPELTADANGDYTARYSDMIYAKPEGSPNIAERQILEQRVDLDFPGQTTSAYEVNIGLTGNVDVRGNQYVQRFDRAEFTNNPDSSRLVITIERSGFTIDRAGAALVISLPSNFEVDAANLPAGVTGSGNRLDWVFDMSGNSAPSVAIPMRVVDVTADKAVSITGKITVPQGANTNITGTPRLDFRLSLDKINYTVIYGDFLLDFDITPTSTDIGSLYNTFEGEGTVLSFRDPHILVYAENELGLPVNVSLELSADNGSVVSNVEEISLLPAPSPGSSSEEKLWIGETNPRNDYTFKHAPGLGGIITETREAIYVSGVGEQGTVPSMFYPKGGQVELEYVLEIPFAPTRYFYAVTRQVVEDAFTGDIVDYLFQGGTAELYGTVTNSMPLSFELEMIITDSAGNPVGITLKPQEIAAPVSSTQASVTKVSFPLSESDMAKMSRAANIDLLFTSHGFDDAPSLNEADKLVLDLKLGKTGGINISGGDDE